MAGRDAVGRAVYETAVDSSGLKKGLGEAEQQVKKTGTAAEQAFGKQATGALGKLDAAIKGIANRGGLTGAILGGAGIGAGLGVFSVVSGAISGVVDNIGKSIDLASDKAEAASKANVLFGNSYGIIERASKTAATAVGLSSGKYIEAAGTVGNLITNLGFAGDAAASMSRDIVGLAADMGSFNNAGTEEVVDAIGAAFRGETEPIRRFGVMLSAAKVEAKALALGLKDGKKPLTDNAKAMATYQLILEQTAAAQGDFARTADGKANADRIRAAKAEEAWTKLGEVLTPLYQKVMPLIAETTTTAIDTITNLANFAAPLVDGALQGIAAAIDTIGDSFTALKELMDPTGTEADQVTRAILEQAKALGLDGDAVLQYTERVKALAKAQRDRAAIAEQIADIDATMADFTKNAYLEIDEYRAALKESGDTERWNNIIMERKLQLNAQLAPYLREKERLTGDLKQAQEEANKADEESAKVNGLASQAIAEYNRMLDESAQYQTALNLLIPRVTTSVGEQEAGFSRAASAINLGYGSVLLATVEAQEKAAKALGPENPKGIAHAVENTIDRMFMTMADAKDPWKAQWQQLAAWAKDPFNKEKFEDYIEGRVRQAMKKARESFGAEKKRWLEIARAYRYIAKNEWIDPLKADIEKIMLALRVADRLTRQGTAAQASIDMLKSGHNAAGTTNWRGGWTWVGERGPELMRLPAGTAIKSNEESARMASQVSGIIEVVVRDPDGGLARAGIGTRELGSDIGAVLRQAQSTADRRYVRAR